MHGLSKFWINIHIKCINVERGERNERIGIRAATL